MMCPTRVRFARVLRKVQRQEPQRDALFGDAYDAQEFTAEGPL
jgi:hypothetical protein